MKDNVIVTKSYSFALRIIILYKFLVKKNEYVISKQILRTAISIEAIINESQSAKSNNDFVYKLSIAAKEIRETGYWLYLLHDSDYISDDFFQSIIYDANEIIKIINSIILTSKKKER